MPSDEVLLRLDDIVSLLKVGFASEITDLRNSVRGDPVNLAILEALDEGWLASGDLQRAIATSQNISPRTVRVRLADLLGAGAIRSRGRGTATEYGLTGIL
jgi:DNA-binding HxlR family transcriptional regulator